MIKANIDGNEVELKPDDLQLGEGYALVTPDKVPDGYFTQDAFEKKIQSRLSKAEDNAKSRLEEDDSFHRQILDKYGVSLGADGKPKGLKPEVDIDEVKRNVAEQMKNEYETKLKEKDAKISSFMDKGLKSTIMDGANQIGIDGKYLEPLVEGGDPYIVKELSDRFAYNEEIGDYALLDPDNTFHVDGNGFVPVSKFFESNKEKFSHMLKDQRQKGSGFEGAGNPSASSPSDILSWKAKQKSEYISKHGAEKYRKAVEQAVQSKK